MSYIIVRGLFVFLKKSFFVRPHEHVVSIMDNEYIFLIKCI